MIMSWPVRGRTGCVVAARLSEDSGQRVLLFEAGPPAENFWINTPCGVAKLFTVQRQTVQLGLFGRAS